MERIIIFAIAAIFALAANGASNTAHAAAWEFSSAEGTEAEEAGPCWMSDGNVQLFYRPQARATSDAIILLFNDPVLTPNGKDLRVILDGREYRAEHKIDDGRWGSITPFRWNSFKSSGQHASYG